MEQAKQETQEPTTVQSSDTKEKYMAVFMADKGEGVIKQYIINEGRLLMFGAAIAVLLVMTMLSILYGIGSAQSAKTENVTLHTTVDELEMQNHELTTENTQLSERVLLLSETVNQKVQAEAEAVEKAIPSGFPMAGVTKIVEEEEETEESGKNKETEENGENKATGETEESEETEVTEDRQETGGKEFEVIFQGSKGSTVIAAGSGTILSIVEDETWGKILEMDHANGYISIYKVDAEPKVKEEDEITRGTLLFEITKDKQKIGYQLMQDGFFIDPMELMKISG